MGCAATTCHTYTTQWATGNIPLYKHAKCLANPLLTCNCTTSCQTIAPGLVLSFCMMPPVSEGAGKQPERLIALSFRQAQILWSRAGASICCNAVALILPSDWLAVSLCASSPCSHAVLLPGLHRSAPADFLEKLSLILQFKSSASMLRLLWLQHSSLPCLKGMRMPSLNIVSWLGHQPCVLWHILRLQVNRAERCLAPDWRSVVALL